MAVSSVYETEPVGEVVDQRDFLNAAAQVQTDLEPLELLGRLKEIERRVGRRPTARHGPRVIDADVLLIGDLQGSFGTRTDGTPVLVVPHALNLTRRFVLEPLLELDPELTQPDGTRLADALAAIGGEQRVTRIAGPEALPSRL